MSKGVPFAYRRAAKTVTKRWFLTSFAREQACSAVITSDGTGSTDCSTVQSKIHFVFESVWEVRIQNYVRKLSTCPVPGMPDGEGYFLLMAVTMQAEHLPQPQYNNQSTLLWAPFWTQQAWSKGWSWFMKQKKKLCNKNYSSERFLSK